MDPDARPRPRGTARHAAQGVAATLLGLGTAHLAAGVTEPSASPVLAVGSTVIDLTPTPLKEWAVRTFGTADKPVLVGSVLVVVLLLAASAGILAARRPGAGTVVLASLAGIAAVAAGVRPTAGVVDPVPAVVAGVVAVLALGWVQRRDAGTTAAVGSAPRDLVSRRGVVLATGGLAAAALATGAAGQWVGAYRLRGGTVTLPAPADPAGRFPAGLERQVAGITPLRTPNADFYRIDTRLVLPHVNAESWSLSIDGDVQREVELSFEDLASMRVVERDITLTCVSNEVGGPYVGSARWLGVPLRDVLDLAGLDGTGADQILSTDVDGMTISTPLAVALDGRDSLIAFGMNGEQLPRAHGFPARMVVPGLYGFVSACKWITRMTLTTYDAQQAYWTQRDWVTDAPVKVSSRVDTPRPLSDLEPGRVVVGGIAWAQHDGIDSVEVRVDGGPWRTAALGPDVGDDCWRQWWWEWDAGPGRHLLASRATTRSGVVQTAVRTQPFPAGATGIHEIPVNVG